MKKKVLLAVAVLVLAFPLMASAQQTQPFEPTRDALFDRYALALLDRFEEFQTDPDRDYRSAGVLPGSVLAGWEAEFRADPRYWQLRFSNDFDTFAIESGERIEDDLEQALALSSAQRPDPSLAWIVLEYRLEQLPKQNDEAAGEVQHAERLELISRECAAFPDESYFLYMLAHEYFSVDDWSAGMEALRRANSAKHNRRPLPFPLPFVMKRIELGQTSGNDMIAGMALNRLVSYPEPGYKGMKRNLISYLEEEGGELAPEDLDAWTMHIYRLGTMEGAMGMDWLVAYNLLQKLSKHVLVSYPHRYLLEERELQWKRLIGVWPVRDLMKQEVHPQTDEFYERVLDYDESEDQLRQRWEAEVPGLDYVDYRSYWIEEKFSGYLAYYQAELKVVPRAHELFAKLLSDKPLREED